jgi:putative peptide maturation dehydrogenase
MPRARRTRHLFVYCADRLVPDFAGLLRGRAEAVSVQQLLAVSILKGNEVAITRDELDSLLALPTRDWVEIGDRPDEARLHELAEAGLVVLEDGAGELAELRRRDEGLRSAAWNAYAALYHGLTRWRDVSVGAEVPSESAAEAEPLQREVVESWVRRHGLPPPHFHRLPDAPEVRELPLGERRGELYDALLRRRTARVFDATRPVSEADFAALLRYVFGCHGYTVALEDVVGLSKTSPSGGGLHPIEAYPLVSNVEGVDPGLYHYAADRHALELVRPLTRDEAEDFAREFTCGQGYFAAAGALFVLTARFYRSFWKYRNHERAYAVMLMDAGHLSQTFYLVAGELGLGAFFTAGVNGGNIDERLGLDGFEQGAIALCGCGHPVRGPTPLEPQFLPFTPRVTPAP